MTEVVVSEEPVEGAVEGQPGSLVMYRMGGRMHPLKTSSRCKVCNSPYRLRVEEEMIAGRGPTFILRNLPEDHGLSIQNIRNHIDYGHLPSDAAVVRAIVDQRAVERGEAYESGAASFVDQVAFLRGVMVKSWERIATGELKVGVEHGMQAAQALAALGVSDNEIEAAMWPQVLMRWWENVRAEVDDRTFERIVRRNDADPVLAALQREFQAKQGATTVQQSDPEDEDFEDAEVVPD